MATKRSTKKEKSAAEVMQPKAAKALKGKAPKPPVMCAKAEKLMQMRKMLTALEKESKKIRNELIEEFGVGAHPGFSVVEKERVGLSQALLEAKLGDLAPYMSITRYMQIDFH